MGFSESMANSNYAFDKNYLRRILHAIINSNELDNSSLVSVISNHRNYKRATKEDIDSFRYKIEDLTALAMIKYDKEQAAKLAGVQDVELLPSILKTGRIKKGSPELTTLARLKGRAYELVKFNDDDRRKYITFNSSTLFPNTSVTSSEPLQHLLTINARPEKYIDIVDEIINRFEEESIPINISVRNITDMVYGFADPIKIYVSSEYLDNAADIVNDVARNNKKDIITPNDLIALNINSLFGYTTVNKDGKTPIEILLNRLENLINKEIVVDTTDWNARARKLKEYHDKNKSKYDYLVTKIDSTIMYSESDGVNLDFGNIFIFPDVFPKVAEEVDEELPEMNLVSEDEEVDEELLDEPINNDIDYILDKKEEEVQEEPTLDNKGVYNNSDIKVDHLSDDEAYSLVSNEPSQSIDTYADEYSEMSISVDEYKDVLEKGIQDIYPVTIDENGRYVELIKYLKLQNVSSIFDKDVILKENNARISGREYVKTYVIPKFMENSREHVYTFDELNNIYLDEIVEKEKDKGSFLSRVFKKR